MIYAFYGMGKTTLAHTYPNLFADLDECYIRFSGKTFSKWVEESKGKCILTNLLTTDVDIAFIPKHISVAIERLKARGVPKSFTDELLAHEKEFYDYFSGCKVVLLDDDEYLSDYLDLIVKVVTNEQSRKRTEKV